MALTPTPATVDVSVCDAGPYDRLERLAERWAMLARELEPYAAPAAEAFRRARAELQEQLTAMTEEVLTLGQAASESGYSADHLARLIRDGRIPNAGRKNAPRIRRGDLPRRTPSLQRADDVHMLRPSRRQLAQAVVHSLSRSNHDG